MASFVERFNAIPTISTSDTRKIKDLIEGVPYTVRAIRVVDTRFGRSAVVTLLDNIEKFDVFLPKRFTSVFETEEKVEPDTLTLTRGKPIGQSFDIKLERELPQNLYNIT